VCLKNPPKTVKIDGLPENIVPITNMLQPPCVPSPTMLKYLCLEIKCWCCRICYDKLLFSGEDRPDNVVDLIAVALTSLLHMLSRSASAAGTIIGPGFDAKVVTGGVFWLSQTRVQRMEILDEITNSDMRNPCLLTLQGIDVMF